MQLAQTKWDLDLFEINMLPVNCSTGVIVMLSKTISSAQVIYTDAISK